MIDTKFIKIDGELYNVASIRKIGELYDHNDTQQYFRIFFTNTEVVFDVEFEYKDHVDTEEQKTEFVKKLVEEKKKLDNFFLTGEGPNTYFQTIDLRK